MVKKLLTLSFLIALGAAGGCGYTTKSNLPEDIKTLYIVPVKNAIDITQEIEDRKGRYMAYRPGLETDLMNAITNRFIFDGTLKVVRESNADLILEASVMEYFRDPLRYTSGDDVKEYRLNLRISAVARRANNQVLWKGDIVGETTYFTSGSQAVSEDEALSKAVEDTANRLVEQIVEIW